MTDVAYPIGLSGQTGARRLRAALLGGCLVWALPLGTGAARAQGPSAVETFTGEAGPTTDAGAIGVAPDGTAKWHGPLAPYAASLATLGLSFDVNVYEYFFANPSAGLRPGQLSNSTYNVLSLDADLNTIAGNRGAAISTSRRPSSACAGTTATWTATSAIPRWATSRPSTATSPGSRS